MKKILSVIMLIATCNVQSTFNNIEEFKRSFERQNVWTQEHSKFLCSQASDGVVLIEINGIILKENKRTRCIYGTYKKDNIIPILCGIAVAGCIVAAGIALPLSIPFTTGAGATGSLSIGTAITVTPGLVTITSVPTTAALGGLTVSTIASALDPIPDNAQTVSDFYIENYYELINAQNLCQNRSTFIIEKFIECYPKFVSHRTDNELNKIESSVLTVLKNWIEKYKEIEDQIQSILTRQESERITLENEETSKFEEYQSLYSRFSNDVKSRIKAHNQIFEGEEKNRSILKIEEQNEFKKIFVDQVFEESSLFSSMLEKQEQNEFKAIFIQQALEEKALFSSIIENLAKDELKELYARNKIEIRENQKLQKIRAIFKSESAVYGLQSVVERQKLNLERQEEQINVQQNQIVQLTGTINVQQNEIVQLTGTVNDQQNQIVQLTGMVNDQGRQILSLEGDRDTAQAWSFQLEARVGQQERQNQEVRDTLNNLISNLPALIAQSANSNLQIAQSSQNANRPLQIEYSAGTHATAPSSGSSSASSRFDN